MFIFSVIFCSCKVDFCWARFFKFIIILWYIEVTFGLDARKLADYFRLVVWVCDFMQWFDDTLNLILILTVVNTGRNIYVLHHIVRISKYVDIIIWRFLHVLQ